MKFAAFRTAVCVTSSELHFDCYDQGIRRNRGQANAADEAHAPGVLSESSVQGLHLYFLRYPCG